MATDATEQTNERPAGMMKYYPLGRSGLKVSPLCLGAMTFGNAAGWGMDDEASRAIFDRYLAAGGNFIDTANLYGGGESETLLGRFMGDAGNRHRLVIATKFGFATRTGDPNSGGNGRKAIVRALEESLRRLDTDYIDLYWLHVWDMMTPEDELMSTLDALVRSGKVRYIGLSNTPGWYVASCQRLAQWRGWEPLVALQLEYSLVERTIEQEHVGAALRFGLGICPWSPLASGLLSGKYTREHREGGRLEKLAGSQNPVFQKFTERNFQIVDAVVEVAKELGRTPSQVAINWATRRPGIVSTLIGATKLAQLEDNLAALDFELPAELAAKLEEASRPAEGTPYMFFKPWLQSGARAGCDIDAEPAWYRG